MLHIPDFTAQVAGERQLQLRRQAAVRTVPWWRCRGTGGARRGLSPLPGRPPLAANRLRPDPHPGKSLLPFELRKEAS